MTMQVFNCDICGAVIAMRMDGSEPAADDKAIQLHLKWHEKLGQ